MRSIWVLVAMTPRGTYASMAVYALNGLLGSIETEGGVMQGLQHTDHEVSGNHRYICR